MMNTTLLRRIALVMMVAMHGTVGVVAEGQEPPESCGACVADTESSRQPPSLPLAPPPVVFEGFGLDGFRGNGSVAAAIDSCGCDSHASEPTIEFKGIDVRGPTGRDAAPAPMAAELRSRIERIDVAAGVTASPERIDEGPSQWTGRIGMHHDGAWGHEFLEIRTMLAPGELANTVGVTVGPRFERRLRRGMTFFLNGQAEARALRPSEAGRASLPGGPDASLATVGVAASTGIVR